MSILLTLSVSLRIIYNVFVELSIDQWKSLVGQM